jgi:hypothetical protein
MSAPPILDVVDEFYTPRDLRSLERRIPELKARLRDVDENWSPPARRDDEIRLLPGLAVLHESEVVVSSALGTAAGREILDEMSMYPRYEISGLMQSLTAHSRAYAASFLYADAVVEPLFAGLLQERGAPDGDHRNQAWNALDVMQALGNLDQMRPLIAQGALVLAPPLVDDQGLLTLARQQTEEFGEYLMARERELGFYWDGLWTFEDLTDQLYDVLRLIRIAAWADATFVPCEVWQWPYVTYLGSRIASLRRDASPTSLTVTAGLASVDLPILRNIPPSTLVKIRSEEDAFVQWRLALRDAARLIKTHAGSAGFEAAAKEIFEDFLVAKTLEVRRATSRSRVLRSAAEEQALRVTLGVVFGSVAGLVVGGSVLESVGAALVAALTNLAYAGLQPSRIEGPAAVVSFLDAKVR